MRRIIAATRGPDRWLSCAYSMVSPIYDFLWVREDMRRDLVGRLRLQTGQIVLETGVGTGANLPLLCDAVGVSGKVEGVDVSAGMLGRAERRAACLPCPVRLTLHNASNLPYPDNSFDAVLHFGGINFFTDRKRAIAEMVRVSKEGARLVIADETLALRGHWGDIISERMLGLFPRLRPPLDLLPMQARVLGLDHSPRGFFYILEMQKDGAVGSKA
ncbi:MAG: methyltransferase domain-containing protein [Actinomycetota bacterium]|nr:methyltransferase domain-containing protein [Actinomycetota bacterium]